MKEQYEGTMEKCKDELNKITLEKEKFAVEIQNCGLSKRNLVICDII